MSLEQTGTVAVLAVRGCLDSGTAPVVRGRVESALEGSRGVVVDLSEVTFFSADAATALAAASRRGRLHVVVTPLVRRVLDAAGATGSLDLHDFPAEAREAAEATARPLLMVG
ncbi:STAS domain-containing protein [Actinosynnema sp. NPDC050436]|uniref:STAS domain-containing protein n=1 Tax=Actinosynnema sp. NPDC050436 TaxID=3155659 RepID=UPI0033C8B0AD